jgi:hypothetical protein
VMRQSCADALATEEPDALIAHVRVCGGAGRVTVGSTRKGVVRGIGRGTRPPHDQPPLIEEQTEFAPNNPAMVGQAFAPDLPRAAPLAHGMDQLVVYL